MASSKQRSPPESFSGPAAKRARPEQPAGPAEPGGQLRVVLNPADCDLDFDIVDDGLKGHALHEKGFAYCWSGARANVGITRGKYCFGCKIVSEQVVDMADTPADQQHVCRVGISKGDDPVSNLGETSHSFGFGGTGKFSNAGKFSNYGEKFGVGDTIVCCINLENQPLATVGFCKNGKWLGIAWQFDASSRGLGVVATPLKDLPWESALFPHVLLKNVEVQLQFSVEDGLVPEEGYKPWHCAIEDGNVIIGPSFSSPQECEVLMMVGLPASGKTTWAEKWVKEHPEKRYVILGTNLALDQMKVPGLLRKQNYGERFERLMDRATGIFNTLLARAAKTPRNYILDQTNVYKSARNRKLKSFVNYHKIAVVVFPPPEELKCRAEKRFKEMGKEVPQEAVNEMTANFVIPTSKDMPRSNEVFDKVMFTEMSRVEAQKHLDEMKRSLKSPTFNARSDMSPYSRERSVQSFSSPVAMKKDAVSGYGQSPQPQALVAHHHDLNTQVSAASTGRSSYVDHCTGPGETDRAFANSSPYGNYSNNDTTLFQRDALDPQWRFRTSSPYMRNDSERSFSSMNSAAGNFRRLSFESPSSTGRSNYGYQVDPPYYGNPDAHFHDPRVPQFPRDEFRRPSVASPNSVSRPGYTYPSEPPSYGSHGAHHLMPGVPQLDRNASRALPPEWPNTRPTTYGSPYASSAPRPPSGTPPIQHPHGSWYR